MTNGQAALLYRKTLSDFLLKKPSVLLQGLLRLSPTIVKLLAALVFLINIRSWPLVWHFNVLILPVYEIRVRWWAAYWRTLFASKKRKLEAKQEFLNSLCPIGEDPTTFWVGVKNWAGPDDCDFNWHLSNSSYPKQLDSARFRGALRICPTFYRAGGWTPLGATHFKFIREIPMFAQYEMRMTCAAWDNKWVYVVIRYVTPKKSKSSKSAANGHARGEKPIPSGDAAPFPALHTPAQPSGTSTPALTTGASTPAASSNPAERIAQLLPAEPDGATLHCIAVCELCFKVGRITVPPALVFALDGFSVPAPDGTRYTRTNPPPSFAAAQALQTPDLPHGHARTLQNFLKGGWREVPAGERWWEDALGGEIEARRVRNLEAVKGVREGLEGALTTY